MKSQFILVLFFLICSFSIAQNEFNRKQLIEEIKNDIKDNNSNQSRRAGNNFLNNFKKNAFNELQEKLISSLIYQLRGKQFNDAEDFYSLFQILNHYAEGGIKNESLDSFLESSIPYINILKHKSSLSYISNCSNILVDSTFFNGKLFKWKFNQAKLLFTFDSIPKIKSNSIDLYCISNNDTLIIHNTQGHLDVLSKKWFGNKGKTDWAKHHIDDDSIWVTLNDYEIDLRKSKYTSYQSKLHLNIIGDKDFLIGDFSDGLNVNPNRITSLFPSFISKDDSIFFKNIYEDINVQGAIEVRGKRIFIFGKNSKNVDLQFMREDKSFISVSTKQFRFEDSRIYANDISFNLSWNQDSIYHPKLNMVYTDSNKLVVFERNHKGMGLAPIRTSYHKLDCYFDRLEWQMDSIVISFSNRLNPKINPALIESFNFYDESRYDDIETFNFQHPAFVLKSLQDKYNGQIFFSLTDISNHYKYSRQDAHVLMSNFAILGLVNYDENLECIKINDKLDFLLNAKLGKIDYDQIRFVSRSESVSSAKMNLLSGDLTVYGVNIVELSDSNQVAIFPKNNDLIIHKNRDFTFDGFIQSGRFSIFGKQMKFIYDLFEVKLNLIDSLQYLVPILTQNPINLEDLVVKTVISDLVGKLCIDKKNNKSGLESHSEFPKLYSNNNSYIYYDKIKNGVYKRDLFSFKLDPFVLDSLLDIVTENLEFPGSLNAPTIFPSFRDTLRLSSNLDLSFNHLIEDEYDAYKGRGSFKDQLYLDNTGLHGKGVIYYLNSVTVTDSVYFYPYRAHAHANSQYISSQISIPNSPNVTVNDATIYWRAFEDQMESRNRELFFSMYKEEFDFDGSIFLTPKHLLGVGDFFYLDAVSSSDNFVFQNRKFTANNSLFSLFKDQQVEKIIMGKDLFSSFNFQYNMGEFSSLSDTSVFDLRINEYELYFDKMYWDFNTESQIYSQLSSKKASIICTSLANDSLTFYADNANYNLQNFRLDFEGVEEISISPVIIQPDSSLVSVLANGSIERLHDAKLYVNSESITQYEFYDGEIDVLSSDSFKGSALFNYEDVEGNLQPIKFSILESNSGLVTGSANLGEEDHFFLDPYFGFKGKVLLNSNQDFMTFDGDVNIFLTCDGLNPAWIPFSDQVDPENVFIDLNIDKPLTLRQQSHTGIMVSYEPTYSYPTFLSKSKRIGDAQILDVNGFVIYDKFYNEYVISSKQKIEDRSLSGNIVTYNPETCSLYAEGDMNLGINSGLLNISSFGFFKAQFNEYNMTGTLDLSFDFLFNKKAAKQILKEFKSFYNYNSIDQSSEIHQNHLEFILGKRLLSKFNRKKRKGKSFIPKSIRHTLYFPQIDLSWDTHLNSFISGIKIPLSNIIGRKVDALVPGIIQIIPYPLGDQTNIYFQLDSDTYYFFSYRRGLMSLYSSNIDFNNIINNSPNRMSRKTGRNNNYNYRYELGHPKQVERFLYKISKYYNF